MRSLLQGAIGSFIVNAPMIVGHETSGTVEAVGEGVEGFAPGMSSSLFACLYFFVWPSN